MPEFETPAGRQPAAAALAHERFAHASLSTDWLDQAALEASKPRPELRWLALATALMIERRARPHGWLAHWSSTAPMERPFEFQGINHLALVCRDMARTVAFYEGVLGMPLVKTVELPAGMGQHFFFDMGNDDCLAFFWFADAPPAQPGVSNAGALPGEGDIATGIPSHNSQSPSQRR